MQWHIGMFKDVKFKWQNQGFYKRKGMRGDFEKFTKSQILKGFIFWTKDTGLNSVRNKAVKGILKSESDLWIFVYQEVKLTYLKRPRCWDRLKVGGEGDDRGWDGWMASLTQWTWVWVSSGSWWWTGRPGMVQSTGLQSWIWLSDWTELNWTEFLIVHRGLISS